MALLPGAAASPPWLALPARLALLERFTLPSEDREELEGMICLQLEKTLPYPVEETTHGFEILPVTGQAKEAEGLAESTVMVASFHLPAVEALCEPLRAMRLHPRLSLWAFHIGAALPAHGVYWALWPEGEEAVFGIFEGGRLAFLETAASPEAFLECLPRTLMSAELAGAPVRFAGGRSGYDAWTGVLEERLGPAEALSLGAYPAPKGGEPVPPDLTPPAWHEAMRREARRRQRKKTLLGVLAVYGALVLFAFLYNGFQAYRLRHIDREIATLQPQVDALLAHQQRWLALAPVTNPRRATVEVLYQINRSLPAGGVNITQFDQTPTGIMITGEAPSAAVAVSLLEALKANKELEYEFTATPPTPLADDRAQFRIFGK